MNITYEDFEKAAKGRGLFERFSDFDLKLARENPDAGMQILNYKTDYYAAETDEARAMANQGAEAVRKKYGGYTGGAAGDWYYKEPVSDATSSFPTVSGKVQSAADKVVNYEPFTYDEEAPTYVSRNDRDMQKIRNEILNRDPFTYDAETDPRFAQYKKQYTREGRRATEDAMGVAAAMTGGIPSSYAMTAAAQAGNQYAAALSDKIPELYEAAYNQYMNEHAMKIQDLDVLRALEESDYQKHRDKVQDYRDGRNFAYDVWAGERDRLVSDADILKTIDDSKYERFTEERAYQDQKEREALERENAEKEERLALGKEALEVGDTKRLQALGIDTSLYDDELKRNAATEELRLALARNEAGDPSLINAILQRGTDATPQTLPLPAPQTQPKTVENTVLPNATVANWAEKINGYVSENYDGQQGMKKMAEGQYEPDFASMEFIIGQVDAAKDLTPEQKVYLLKKLGIDVEDQKVANIIMQRQMDASARRQ